PEYGRYFNPYGGGMYRGAMLTKNELGIVCVFFGLFYLWTILSRADISDLRRRREEMILSTLFLAMIFYLLSFASSAAALVVFAMGTAIMVGFGMRLVSRRYFGTYVVGVIAIVAIVQLTFGIYGQLLEMLGKDVTLTDRTDIWSDVIELQTNPLIGMGFESFWLGSRIATMWEKWWWHPNQAHNGYIETYLNLGFVGLGLLFMIVVSAFRRISSELQTDFEFARFKMAILFGTLAYNVTEAMFKGVALTWLMFHIVVLVRGPSEQKASVSKPVRAYAREAPGEPIRTAAEPTATKHGQTSYYRRRVQ
ncbi:MAG: O-antigen ligase family protein, partial [Gammaproteobacteria bacterium]